MRLRRRLPFHMSAGAVGRSRTQMAAVPTKLSVSNWIGLHAVQHGCHRTEVEEAIGSEHRDCLALAVRE